MRYQTKNSRRRGQAMVEGALCILLFTGMVVAVFDFGQVLYFQQALGERARAAARYAAINPTLTTNIQNVALYGSPTAAQGAKLMLPGLTSSMVQVTTADLDKTTARVTIRISGYQLKLLTPGIAKTFSNLGISITIPSEAAS